MRKSTIFISAVLTTFALVMLYRVASAYNDNRVATQVAAAPSTSLPAPAATDPPADTAPAAAALGPVDAAQLAAKVVGNTNLLSAESSNFNGVPAYMITFTNNDVVYVSLDGQILSVQMAPVTPPAPVVVNVVAPPAKNNHGNGGSSSGGSHESGGESEGHDD
jgi:hypothetical protein